MKNKQIAQLFLASFIAIIITYSIFLGKVKTILLFVDAYVYISLVMVLLLPLLYYKRKLSTV
jgi:hypothetical protein